MIDFSTLQGLTIPEGVVTQIVDASGRVLWVLSAESSGTISLEVAKFTSNTYAAETLFEDETFILLDIYPLKANSKVDVTYGGFTKTIRFNGTNAQRVFFGTFNGVTDEVETPESGTLTITGGYSGFGTANFIYNSKADAQYNNDYCTCIKGVNSLEGVTLIPSNAFRESTIEKIVIPSTVTELGDSSFEQCSALAEVDGGNITRIGARAFYNCESLSGFTIPSTVTELGDFAFSGCAVNTDFHIPNGMKKIGDGAFNRCVGFKNINIPASVEMLGANPFRGRDVYACDISVSPENKMYRITDACLIDITENSVVCGFVDSSIPGSVQKIGAYAFYGLSPSVVTRSFTVHENITEIGDYAFNQVVASVKVTFLCTNPPTLGSNVFHKVSGLSINVPQGCGDIYKAAEGWSEYAEYITEVS